jgi:catechol 2,3-dioxygenase-like lactoylglutathione lyase family enzyme
MAHPAYEIALTHFIVSDDVERSRRFYTEVLGGKTIRSGKAKQHETEIRCYIRDPDGYLIEVGQTTLPGGWRQFLNQ